MSVLGRGAGGKARGVEAKGEARSSSAGACRLGSSQTRSRGCSSRSCGSTSRRSWIRNHREGAWLPWPCECGAYIPPYVVVVVAASDIPLPAAHQGSTMPNETLAGHALIHSDRTAQKLVRLHQAHSPASYEAGRSRPPHFPGGVVGGRWRVGMGGGWELRLPGAVVFGGSGARIS